MSSDFDFDFDLPELPEIPDMSFDSTPLFESPVNSEPVNSEPEVSDEIKALERARVEADYKAAQAQAEINAAQRKIDEIKQRQIELRKQLEAEEAALGEIAATMFPMRQRVNEARREAAAYESQIEVARQAIKTQKEIEATEEEFARRAVGKAWHEGIPSTDDAGNPTTIRILDHQWVGAKFLAASKRAILGDKMGLGKTLTSIAALDLVNSKRALVIAPAEVTNVFVKEIKRWAPHRRVVNIKGATKIERQMTIQMAVHFEPVVVVTNYESWRKDFSLLKTILDAQFDTIITDEAHTYKETNTAAFRGVAQIALSHNMCVMCSSNIEEDKCVKCGWIAKNLSEYAPEDMSISDRRFLAQSAKNFWAMTGTPILNAPEDMFPMLHLLDPITFHSKNAFLGAFCRMNPYTGRWAFRSGGVDSLIKRLRGRFLARSPEDAGIKYPPQHPIIHELDIDSETYPDQVRVIQQLTKHSQIVLSDGKRMDAISLLALITRKRQANTAPGGIVIKEKIYDSHGHPVRDPDTGKPMERIVFSTSEEIKESIKADKAMSLIMEHGLMEGQRIAVFSQFKSALHEMERRLNAAGISNVRLDGDTPQSLRDQIKTNFDKSIGEEPKWQVVLAHYKTGGVGLTLTSCTHTIIMDEEWNPGKRDQAYGRTQRIGQDRETFVHVLRISNSIDTWMAGLIEEKEDLVAGFETSTRDLQDMLMSDMKKGEVI